MKRFRSSELTLLTTDDNENYSARFRLIFLLLTLSHLTVSANGTVGEVVLVTVLFFVMTLFLGDVARDGLFIAC